MASSKTLSKLCNTLFPFTDFLYLLQQEEYSLQRFHFWFWRFFFRRNIQKRDTLKYTQRVKTTFLIAVLLWSLGGATIILSDLSLVVTIILFALWAILIPFFVVLANAITTPFYNRIKSNIITRATKYFKEKRGDVKVIAVTGSYGKTTIKNFTEQFLKYDVKTQMIPGNINSTIGIAQWILQKFQPGTEALILEMDAYAKGRIARTCSMVRPDIAILSNVGDQHIVRFGNQKGLAESLSEIFLFSDASVKLSTQETVDMIQSYNISTEGVGPISYSVDTFVDLSESNKSNLSFALAVAKLFEIPQAHIQHILTTLVLPDRRQSKETLYGYEAINDSYNISFTTAKAGIDEAVVQAKKVNKKLVVITAGIPELGKEDADKNIRLGEYLNDTADKVIVLKSILAKDIERGISDVDKKIVAKDLKSAIAVLKETCITSEWFLLLQPELTDEYY